MDLRIELEKNLAQVGAENIWRPVFDNHNVLLAEGVGEKRDGRPQDISKVDFRGKTVLDLGCNFGFYSFLAKRLDARKVVGVDDKAQIIRGCELLKAMHGVEGVHFRLGDFMNSNSLGKFDICMLINFIGKKMVKKGIKKILETVRMFSLSTMIISARPYYDISKHLDGDAENITNQYSSVYIKNGKFHLMEFIHDFFCEDWEMSVLSPLRDPPSIKRPLLFGRK
jgi:SAM-dependent methyltransferase